MGKRPASRDDDDEVDREAECRGTLRALNAQFASWVSKRAVESPIVSWAEVSGLLKARRAQGAFAARETTFGRDDGQGTIDRDGVVAWGVLGRLTRERPRVRW